MNLGSNLCIQYELTRDIADLSKAIGCFCEVANSRIAFVTRRLRACKYLLRLYAHGQAWQDAFEAGCKAIKLLPALAPRSLPNSDKQRVLTSIAGLANDTAVLSVRIGKFLEAVQSLEQGRGVIAGNVIDLRSVPLDLEQKHPRLAQRFNELRERSSTDAPVDDRSVPEFSDPLLRNNISRQQASEEFDQVLQNIRKLRGFESFLQPPSQHEIQGAASKGPIVYILVSDYGCNAIIIARNSIRAISLPRLSAKDIEIRKVELPLAHFTKSTLLQWLWDAVTSPVLEALHLSNIPVSGQLSRIWWIPTGLLSRFPIHAAGYHFQTPPKAVVDVVVSSYTSTVRALLRGRSSSLRNRSESDCAVLVAMEVTPEATRLPFAKAETLEIEKICRSASLATVEPECNKQSVLDAIQSCKVLHFAGHAVSDLSEPLQSHLLLEDHKKNPMTLADLLNTDAFQKSPFLAYLSACETGRVQDERVIDEGLHLVNAFQLAGFRHVIGTLWEVDDEVCKDIARITYTKVLERGMTDESVCLGLHEALKWSRDHWRSLMKTVTPNSILHSTGSRDFGLQSDARGRAMNWVPYVHFGV